ncbi:nuclear pore complex-interacting protein family member B13-like [Stylophora pistillata]|uniref:nuclear pore complex-interacting protein family member B13-like n=1 Tax=Stylophora pistillata TaxID=50429 RepID=UPI000C0548AB|nr:nuclear pore complex-interacting protein family member B13-like [Stylophora pistillata]
MLTDTKRGSAHAQLFVVFASKKDTGVNFQYSWVSPAVHGTATDELEDVHVDTSDNQQSFDENLPLASALPPRKSSNENLTLEYLSSTHENLTPENLPSIDDNLTPENLPSTDENLTPENLPSTDGPPPTDENLAFDQLTDPLSASSELSPTPPISSDSPILDPQGLITSTKPAEPPSRRTAASLAESSLAFSRKPTTPTLVTGKPRSSIPVPTSTPTSSLHTHENDRETIHDLKQKSFDLSPSRKETSTPEKKKGKNRNSEKQSKSCNVSSEASLSS